MTQVPPASPCINVCVLDAQLTCVGCRRTLDEIGRWATMGAAEQWRVITRLEHARQQEALDVARRVATN